MVDAKPAEQLGLVRWLCHRKSLERLCDNSPLKLPGKGGFGVVASTEDLQEGVSAFIEKRKLRFKGKQR